MNESKCQCNLCNKNFSEKEIERLKCNHAFCIKCLDDYIIEKLDSPIKCPDSSCSEDICDQIIRNIIDDEHVEKYDQIMLSKMRNMHCCILPECSYYTYYDDNNVRFECSFCSLYNCIKCQAAHIFCDCEKYQMSSADEKEQICKKELDRAKKICDEKNIEKQRKSIKSALSNVLIPNPEIFQCITCGTLIRKKMGVQLRNCFHCICRDCLVEYVKSTHEIPIPCPYDCKLYLEDPEIREILSEEDKEIYNTRMMNIVMPKLQGAMNCQKPNCEYIVEIYGKMKNWKCKVCKSVNCINCKAIHLNQTCQEYQTKQQENRKHIEEMIKRKELMKCPTCNKLIQKSGGCNWIKCRGCATELCWINQTYRWGPKGRGDISGGCRCLVDEKYCHEDCDGCIPENDSSNNSNNSCHFI